MVPSGEPCCRAVSDGPGVNRQFDRKRHLPVHYCLTVAATRLARAAVLCVYAGFPGTCIQERGSSRATVRQYIPSFTRSAGVVEPY